MTISRRVVFARREIDVHNTLDISLQKGRYSMKICPKCGGVMHIYDTYGNGQNIIDSLNKQRSRPNPSPIAGIAIIGAWLLTALSYLVPDFKCTTCRHT